MMSDKNIINPRDAKTYPKPSFPKQNTGAPPGLESRMDPAPRYVAPNYKGSEKLKEKIALITGGDSGIGRAVAVLFAREGAHVAITYTRGEEEDAHNTCEAIRIEGGKPFAIELDATLYQSCEQAVLKTIDTYGQLDILVNNAAYQNHLKTFEDLTIDQWDHTFKVNIYGYYYMVKAAKPFLKPGSCVINTSSVLSYEGDANLIDYAATKGAIHNMTKSLAKALSKDSIRVNAVAPGPVWTPLNPAERTHEETKTFGKETSYGRPAQPEEIAPAYVYLASNITSSYISGETINIFGDVSAAN